MSEEKIDIDLLYYERNIMFLKESQQAVYKYEMEPYEFLSDEQKKAILKDLHDFFYVYRGKGKILLYNKLLTPDEILEALDELQQDNPFPKTYEKWKEDMRLDLERQQPWTPVLYFVLDIPARKLGTAKVDVVESYEKGGGKKVAKDLFSSISSSRIFKTISSNLAQVGVQVSGMLGGDIAEEPSGKMSSPKK